MSPNYVSLAFGGLMLLSALPSLGGLGDFRTNLVQARIDADRIGADMVDLKLSQQEAAQKAEIANGRYQDGCLPVVSDNQQHYVSLVEGYPVVDAVSRVPLPAGSVVCDANGNTAVLVDDDQSPETPAIATSFAFTGNKAVIDERLRNYRGAAYSLPNN